MKGVMLENFLVLWNGDIPEVVLIYLSSFSCVVYPNFGGYNFNINSMWFCGSLLSLLGETVHLNVAVLAQFRSEKQCANRVSFIWNHMESGNESHRICRVHGLGADWAGSEEATEIAGNSNQEACCVSPSRTISICQERWRVKRVSSDQFTHSKFYNWPTNGFMYPCVLFGTHLLFHLL